MCSAGSPTCCSPSKAIRRCCSISTTARRSARTRSPASIAAAASTRISRARSSSCIRSACAAVYTQDDVTNFAKVLTGWTICRPRRIREHGGEFVFDPRMHEPGPQTVVGKRYLTPALEQGRAVLADLARHPATAKHVAAQARAPFRCRRSAAGAGRAPGADASSTPTATSRSWPRRWSQAPEAWAASARKIKRPERMDRGGAARDRRYAGGLRPHRRRRRACSASRCGGRRRRKAFPTTNAAWLDGLRAAARHRQRRLRSRDRRWRSIRRRCSKTALGPLASAETRRRPSRAPRAGRRRWRCC